MSSPGQPSTSSSEIRRNNPAIQGSERAQWLRSVRSLAIATADALRRVASLDDGSELPYDLFLGVPKHRAPTVVEASGLAEGGWVTVNPRSLETKFPNVYAIGDIANTGTPKAGVFAEGAATVVATSLVSRIRGEGQGSLYAGAGTRYIEFGAGRIGRVDVDFFSGPKPTGTYHEPSSR